MNGVLGHLCAHLVKTGTGEPPEDDKMTLPSGHRSRNSWPGGLRPSTPPLGHGGSHNIESLRVSGEEHLVSLKLDDQSGVRTRDLRLSKQSPLTTAPGPQPRLITITCDKAQLSRIYI